MARVLRIKQPDCVGFPDDPPGLSCAHSLRFGRYGVSIMSFKRSDHAAQLAAGSSNASYNLDFRANVAPPPPPQCESYCDILGALQGLTTYANAWNEPMPHPQFRLREFVAINMDADQSAAHTPRGELSPPYNVNSSSERHANMVAGIILHRRASHSIHDRCVGAGPARDHARRCAASPAKSRRDLKCAPR
jgi:hypothetical protein